MPSAPRDQRVAQPNRVRPAPPTAPFGAHQQMENGACTVIAVNILTPTPMSSVTAKPLTDPEAYIMRMRHVIAVHMLESKIEVNARLKPASIAALSVFPNEALP